MSSVPTPAERYLQHPQVETLQRWLQKAGQPLLLKGLAGSSTALVAGALGPAPAVVGAERQGGCGLFVPRPGAVTWRGKRLFLTLYLQTLPRIWAARQQSTHSAHRGPAATATG